MSLSQTELAAVVTELQQLAGGTMQKIAAPAARTVILELRIPGATQRLEICAESDETRIHLLRGPRPPSPASPLPIQNLLRAHLSSSRLNRLELVPGERIVRLHFETPGGARILIAELTGRQGNLILVGAEERILGAAVMGQVGPRRLVPGQPYELPPPPPQAKDRGPRFLSEPLAGGSPISDAIEAHYGPAAVERALEERRQIAARALAKALRRVETAMGKVEADLERAKDAQGLRRMGDLLAPLASRIPRGATKVVATDYTEEGPVEVEVALRPELSGSENRDLFYRRYKRLSGAVERIEARRRELAERSASLRSIAARLEEAEGATLDRLLEEADALGPQQRRGVGSGKVEPTLPYRIFISASGRPIWVGKGAKANDALTFRMAKGNDLWMHARGRPGAHVVVPQQKGSELDQQTLLDACALAAHFSGARGEAVAEIAETQVKNVKKPRGAAPGAVTLANEKSRAYRHDDDRIGRLLKAIT